MTAGAGTEGSRTEGSRTIVFVGPTLPAAEVAARLPGARALPPVAVGDVLALRRRGVGFSPLRIRPYTSRPDPKGKADQQKVLIEVDGL